MKSKGIDAYPALGYGTGCKNSLMSIKNKADNDKKTNIQTKI
jgi:hypothetical protein